MNRKFLRDLKFEIGWKMQETNGQNNQTRANILYVDSVKKSMGLRKTEIKEL